MARPGGYEGRKEIPMKVKDVLELWSGWDSPDIFEIHEISQKGRRIASYNMTGLELMDSYFAERSLKRFGSYGKGTDGTWRHYIEVTAE